MPALERWSALRRWSGRLAACVLPLIVGVGAALCLLLLAGGSPRQADAANTLHYPGCAATIQQCLTIAQPGDSVVITAGTYITSLTLSRAVSLTGVASNTTILSALPNNRVLTVTGGAINSSVVISGLTFTGGSVGGTGNCPASCGGGILIDGNTLARPQLENIRLVSNSAQIKGGGLFVTGTVALSNSQFISNISHGGGAGAFVTLQGATQTVSLLPSINGGLFQGNQCILTTGSSCQGGGLNVVGTLVMAGATFISNSATSAAGGAIANAARVSGGLFQGNQCTDNVNGCFAGGLFANFLTMTGTQFLTNTATEGAGGGLAATRATLNGGLFQDNQCTGTVVDCIGGGLAVVDALTLTDTLFRANLASTGGGAWVSNTASLQGGLFEDNQCSNATCVGGGLVANNVLEMVGTRFTGNQAGFEGGGAYVLGPATVQAGLFQDNACTLAGCKGGGLFAADVLALTGTRLLGNAAALGGGLYFESAANARIVNALFAGNHALTAGAALELATPGSVVILDTTIATPTVLGASSAIAVFTGSVGITDTIISGYAVGISRTAGAVFEDYNLFFGVATTATAGVTSGGHSLIGNPAFLNPAANDYHLTATSAALGKGKDAGVPTDFEGDPRPSTGGFDIGFDEFVWPNALYLPLVHR